MNEMMYLKFSEKLCKKGRETELTNLEMRVHEEKVL